MGWQAKFIPNLRLYPERMIEFMSIIIIHFPAVVNWLPVLSAIDIHFSGNVKPLTTTHCALTQNITPPLLNNFFLNIFLMLNVRYVYMYVHK